MSKILSVDKIRRRTRRNAIDFAGHAMLFFVELGLLVIFSVSGQFVPKKHKFLVRCLMMSSYGICACINFLSSDILQNETSQIMDGMIGNAITPLAILKFVGVWRPSSRSMRQLSVLNATSRTAPS